MGLAYRNQGPGADELQVPAEALPRQEALHVHVQLVPECDQGLVLGLQPGRSGCSQRHWGSHPLPPTPAARPQTTHLVTASWASWLGGGTRKHTEGTAASLPQLLSTFQWHGCAGPTSWHSSPLCTVTWGRQSCHGVATPTLPPAGPGPPPTPASSVLHAARCPHLHLLVVTHGQQRHTAPHGLGWAAGLQLYHSLGPLSQACEVSPVLIQLVLLVLQRKTAQRLSSGIQTPPEQGSTKTHTLAPDSEAALEPRAPPCGPRAWPQQNPRPALLPCWPELSARPDPRSHTGATHCVPRERTVSPAPTSSSHSPLPLQRVTRRLLFSPSSVNPRTGQGCGVQSTHPETACTSSS